MLNGEKLVAKMAQFFPNIQLSLEDVQAVPLVTLTYIHTYIHTHSSIYVGLLDLEVLCSLNE